MEYCEKGDLRNYLSKHKMLAEEEAQEIAAQVLQGLKFMHEEGFAHRDLKPAVS
jgi:ser/thr/tyr protein kinase RAD53